jgi:ribosomal protein S3
MGFKIVLKGRFSRKQRVSSILLQQGKIPLNTLNIDIDYSFYTIPLKNSATSIKI